MSADTLQVTVEASDSAIRFSLDNILYMDEYEPWKIVFHQPGEQSNGGPGLITTESTTERVTSYEGALATINFYGASDHLDVYLLILTNYNHHRFIVQSFRKYSRV